MADLTEACKKGDLALVKKFINEGHSIDGGYSGRTTYGLTPLMAASSAGYSGIVRYLLENNADVNKIGHFWKSALHLASENGELYIVNMLISKGAHIEAGDHRGWTPLMMAAEKGHQSVVEVLISSGASLNKKNKEGRTALHCAIKANELQLCYCLIKAGADMSVISKKSQTDLVHEAVKKGLDSQLITLILAGAPVNDKDEDGQTILHYACRYRQLDIVKMLIFKGADIDAEGEYMNSRTTPLMIAAELGHQSVVEVLILSGASLNKKNERGCTALHYACENVQCHLDIVNVLILKGAHINVEDQDGWTPLMRAAMRGHYSMVEMLISSGASLHKKTMEGYTALHYAAESKHVQCSCLLIEAGADMSFISKESQTELVHEAVKKSLDSQLKTLVLAGAPINLKDEDGQTILHYACKKTDMDLVNMLISKRADIDVQDHDGLTPLMRAAESGHHLLVEVLISSGASLNKKNEDSRTALHYAAAFKHVQSSCLLIEAGADMSIISKESQITLVHEAVKKGLDSQLKTLILAGAPVNHQDEDGRTALHYAAEHNHIQCGILLAEGGADIQHKDQRGQTPVNFASKEFKAAVNHALSFRSKKTICIIGNAYSGKSTLIASLQNENEPFMKKVSNWIFGVKDIRQRTTGIEPVSLSSKKYGNVAIFDFAGQHEYHGPHEMFLESILTKTGSTVTIILVVKVTEEESVISKQLFRWLTPISKMCSSSAPVRVIVVGSFLDKVKSKAQSKQSKEKLSHCYKRIQEDLKNAAMEFQGTCFLDCRQPYSDGIDQLCQWLNEVPTPLYKAADTQYSISWVISRINHTFDQKAIRMIDLTKWMNDNKADLPTNLPSAEVVCSDLSATGHFLYLPNKVDSSKSWLILDLAAILHDVYGSIFSPRKKNVDKFGLLKCLHLQQLFSTLDEDMIHNVLIALEFCIEVDPTLLSEEIMKLKGSEKDNFLFFPALVSANPQEIFPCLHAGAEVHTLCWQLQADEKHFISPRLMQTTILRLAAHQVFHHQLGRNSSEHCCSVWWNGISWQSPDGVDVAAQISDNALVQVLGRSKAGPDVLCQYISGITSHIIATILQLLPDFSANSYIICSSDPISLLKEHEKISSHDMFPVSSLLSIMTEGKEFCFSLDQSSPTVQLQDLFSGVCPSLDTVQKLCFNHLVHSEVVANKTQPLLPPVEHTKDTEIAMDPPSSPPTLDGSPSESDLLKVLDMVPEWYDLAVALGVPLERVKHFQQIKTGGIEALCYWRYGESGQTYPTSWRFLLDKIEERRGLYVAQRVREAIFAKPSFADPKKTQSSSNSETSTLTTSPSDVSNQLLAQSPRDSELLLVLDQIPHWYDLALALGVPREHVKHFQESAIGGLEALCYWRNGQLGRQYPTSWKFLLDKIKESEGPNVAQDVKRIIFSKKESVNTTD